MLSNKACDFLFEQLVEGSVVESGSITETPFCINKLVFFGCASMTKTVLKLTPSMAFLLSALFSSLVQVEQWSTVK